MDRARTARVQGVRLNAGVMSGPAQQMNLPGCEEPERGDVHLTFASRRCTPNFKPHEKCANKALHPSLPVFGPRAHGFVRCQSQAKWEKRVGCGGRI